MDKREDAESFEDLFVEEEEAQSSEEGKEDSKKEDTLETDDDPKKEEGSKKEEPEIDSKEEDKDDEGGNEDDEGKEKDDKKEEKEDPKFEGSAEFNFVKQFGIMDGMVKFDDGTEMHIDEMEPEQKYQVMMGLASSTRPAPEEEIMAKYDLNEQEIDLLNKVREGKNLDQVILDKAKELVIDYQAQQAIGEEVNYKEMSDDDVTEKFLRDRDPEATDEEIQKQLEVAKESPRYSKIADRLRNEYTESQEAEKEKFANKVAENEQQELEQDRKAIVQAAASMDQVAGWPLNDEMKNEVLADLVEVNEEGDSAFMSEVLGNPENLFQAAFLTKYGPLLFNNLNDYYKEEVQKAYQKGIADEKSGKSSSNYNKKVKHTKGSAETSKEDETKEKQSKVKIPDESETFDLDSLYDD